MQSPYNPYARPRPNMGYDAPPTGTGGIDPAFANPQQSQPAAPQNTSYYNQFRGQAGPTFGGRSDEEIARQNALYNWEQPGFAFDTYLQSQGYNPYAANPFVQSMRSMAPGLANAYMSARAQTPGQTGDMWAGQDYQNFLRGAVGQPGQSQVYGTLRDAAQNMTGLIQQTRGADPGYAAYTTYANAERAAGRTPQAVQAWQAANPGAWTNAGTLNPFLFAAQERLAANQGEGGTDMLMSFYGPMMGRGLRQSYSGALEQARANAQRSFWSGGNLLNNDLYTYLFGV